MVLSLYNTLFIVGHTLKCVNALFATMVRSTIDLDSNSMENSFWRFGVFFLLTRSKSVSEKDDDDDEAGWLVMLKSVRPDGYILFLILAIYNYDTWPKSIHFVAKVGSNSK